MATTTIDSNDVALYISTNLTTPSYKEIVCAKDHNLDTSKDVNTVKTKTCGPLVSAGATTVKIGGSGVASTTPESDELSADDVAVLNDASTPVLVKLEHRTDPTKYYRAFQGIFTSYSENLPVDGTVDFDYELTSQGTITYVAP